MSSNPVGFFFCYLSISKSYKTHFWSLLKKLKIQNLHVNCDVLLCKLIVVAVTYMYQLRCVVSMFDFYLKLSKSFYHKKNQSLKEGLFYISDTLLIWRISWNLDTVKWSYNQMMPLVKSNSNICFRIKVRLLPFSLNKGW